MLMHTIRSLTNAIGTHKASLTHEVIAAAASYEAAKTYQKHLEKSGEPPSHAKAKEISADFSGAFIDHIVETKSLDFIDKQKSKHQAYQMLSEESQKYHQY